MAGCRPIIQEMMDLGHPTRKIHILIGKDVNKMGRYITHLTNLMTGPTDHLPYISKDI